MTSLRVGVVGGGQLARMMAPAATALGVTLRVLAEDSQGSAAASAHEVVVGLPADSDAVAALLADSAPDVVTWEHEHIPASVFGACAEHGVPAYPSESALTFAQDKIEMRARLTTLGLPCPGWARVETVADVDDFLAEYGGTAVLKTARGGYDGKGVRIITSSAEAVEWLEGAAAGGPRVLIEEKVDYSRELAVLVARTPSGKYKSWTTVESVQRNGVCSEVIAPAPHLSPALEREAQNLAMLIATKLNVVGVLAVELFQVGQDVLVNELAMRPHNSGHWTIDGSVTSQFEQHLRAVLDLPLGDTSMKAPVVVMANVLGGSRTNLTTALAEISDAGAKVHLYGKDVLPGRKVGHVTALGDDPDETLERAVATARIVSNGGQS